MTDTDADDSGYLRIIRLGVDEGDALDLWAADRRVYTSCEEKSKKNRR